MADRKQNIVDFSKPMGIGGKYTKFIKNVRNKSDVESIISSNSSNAYISLGKDRVASPLSGMGGLGDPACDAIDIVVGPLGESTTTTVKGKEVININPHFGLDKARIYITQKGNIDDYFGLEDGVVGEKGRIGTSREKSAIALKADHLRFISRESIKLVSSGTDDTEFKAGVYLIAENNEEKLQSMVLGENLVDYIDNNLVKSLSETLQIMFDFMKTQNDFNASVVQHTHLSPFFGKPTSVSFNIVGDGVKNMLSNFENMIKNIKASANNEIANKFPLLPLSKKYFLSKYHKLN